MKTKIRANIAVCFLKEQQTFIAYSPAVDLSTCGRTLAEAKKNFEEAFALFVEECEAMGTLREVLESCGWVRKSHSKKWQPPVYLGEDRVEIPSLVTA